MFEEQPENLRLHIKELATQALQKSEPSAWFEILYAEALGDTTQIPWAKLAPHPYLQNWLSGASSGEGRRALVIGCGLGDDAEALANIGFEVIAFDISPTAITWCQQRFSHSKVDYVVADLLTIPLEWRNAFDLVFESRNIQSLPLCIRLAVIESVASTVAPDGTLLMITRFRETQGNVEGPPWPLSNSELAQFENLGLHEKERLLFVESAQFDVKQLWIEYQRLYSH